jgi:hypothetical protein
MVDPFVFSLKVQEAAVRGGCEGARAFTASTLRFLQQQETTLAGPQRRRADDVGKTPPAASRGPDLLDHYGRRHHDVDIENI